MHKGFLRTASLLGALSVILGAFGAHVMKDMVSERAVSTFETAVRYQFYHVFALLITAILYKNYRLQTMRLAGWFFISGIILFSGSLYVLTFIQAAVMPGYDWIGVITPIGGAVLIGGWIFLFISFIKHH
ncbi:MAG TPA: DUF423 domain-containing protein [Ferruginibacter sp.]|nr:DUF423 domain-containing protein [Ferruginibacter sp.]